MQIPYRMELPGFDPESFLDLAHLGTEIGLFSANDEGSWDGSQAAIAQ
jgi:hypothetical protein